MKRFVVLVDYIFQQNGDALCYVKPELMNEEICKLAVSKNGDV
jgi:hypothetical protein